MAVKGKRFVVEVHDVVLNRWRAITLPLTNAEADKFIANLSWVGRKMEVKNVAE